MSLVTNTFEGGSNGAAVTAGNSGGASGNAFDAVVAGVSLTYANSPARGSLSGRCEGSVAQGASYVSWATSRGTLTESFDRFELYAASAPGSAVGLWQTLSGGAAKGRLRVNTDGTISLLDTSGTQRALVATPIPTNQWVRIEVHIIHSLTVGQLEVRLYSNPDSTSITDSAATTAAWDMGASSDEVRIGVLGSIAHVRNLDNLAAGGTNWLGPAASGVVFQPPPPVRAAGGGLR